MILKGTDQLEDLFEVAMGKLIAILVNESRENIRSANNCLRSFIIRKNEAEKDGIYMKEMLDVISEECSKEKRCIELIPSKTVRDYMKQQGRILTDFEKATLIYNHSGMDYEEKTEHLKELLESTENPELKKERRICMYLMHYCSKLDCEKMQKKWELKKV